MMLRVTASVLALVMGVAASSAAQSADPVLTHYLAAHDALAAGDREAASAALAALAAASADTTIVSRAQAAATETDLAAMRRAFRDLSQSATRWRRPEDVVVYFCAESDGGRGAFWLQRAGAALNPYDQGSTCGSEISIEQVSLETSVVGYLDTYGRPDSYSATRLDAPLLDVPLAVTPITRDLMNDQNTLDVNDAVRNSSTTTPITGFGHRPNFYIVRGFYVFNYRDGIRTQLDGSAPVNPFALDGVEVLRGPSSILYGKGEPGGLVNFTSKRPVPVLGGSLGFNFGSNGLIRQDVDLTGPLGGAAAGRVIVSNFTSDSYRDSVDSDGLYVNPSLSLRLGSRTSLWMTGEYMNYHYVPDAGVLLHRDSTVPPYFTRERYAGDPRVAAARMTGFRFAAEANVKLTSAWELRLVGGTEDADQHEQVHFINLIDGASTGYLGLIDPNTLLRVRFEETPQRRYGYGRIENVWRFAHGSGGIRVTHQLLASVDYRRDTEDLETFVTDHDVLSYVDGSTSTLLLGVLPVGQGLIYNYTAATDTTQSDTGVAAQDLIAIGTRLNLLAGFRFEANRIDTVRTGTEQITGALGGPVTSLDAAPPAAESTSVAPRLGVVFKATPRLSFYGSYLTAFNSPVPGLLSQAGDLLTPEHSRQRRGRRQDRAASGSRVSDRLGLQEHKRRCLRVLSRVCGECGTRRVVGRGDRAGRIGDA